MHVNGDEGVKRVIEYALEIGFSHSISRGGHLRFTKPGRRTVFFSKTPGDRRAYKNGITKLRNADRRLGDAG